MDNGYSSTELMVSVTGKHVEPLIDRHSKATGDLVDFAVDRFLADHHIVLPAFQRDQMPIHHRFQHFVAVMLQTLPAQVFPCDLLAVDLGDNAQRPFGARRRRRGPARPPGCCRCLCFGRLVAAAHANGHTDGDDRQATQCQCNCAFPRWFCCETKS